MQKVNKEYTIDKPKIILLESDIPTTFKIAAIKKINMMEIWILVLLNILN